MRKKRPDRKYGEYTEEEMRIVAPRGTAVVDGLDKLTSYLRPFRGSPKRGRFVFDRMPQLPPGSIPFNLRDQCRLG